MPTTGSVRTVLLWHVHGSWTESFVQGRHRYLLPLADGGAQNGRGLRGRRWPRADEVALARLADEPVYLVVMQRPDELELARRWLRRRPGVDVPAVYVEHNAPHPWTAATRSPTGPTSRSCTSPTSTN